MLIIPLVATSFGHLAHYQANAKQNLKDRLRVVYIDFKSYVIPFTPMSKSVNNLELLRMLRPLLCSKLQRRWNLKSNT